MTKTGAKLKGTPGREQTSVHESPCLIRSELWCDVPMQIRAVFLQKRSACVTGKLRLVSTKVSKEAAVARSPGIHPVRLIRRALSNPVVRNVLGSLSDQDLAVLATAERSGELASVASPIMRSHDPSASARANSHPVAQILAKIPAEHLSALAEECRPNGCDH